MFGMGPWELIIIFAIVLLMFGGKRLPGLATGLGNAIRNFKSALNEPQKELPERDASILAKEIDTKETTKTS